ncbi:MAG: dockerin type I domain-containing protein [Phycisphaerae bacterium]
MEICVRGQCKAGTSPCTGGLACDENIDQCFPCVSDNDCSDGLFCTGVESCDTNVCTAGQSPCTPLQVCLEGVQQCCTPIGADFNCSGTVDAADLALFVPCLSGPSTPAVGQCIPFDLDGDRFITAADYALLVAAVTP